MADIDQALGATIERYFVEFLMKFKNNADDAEPAYVTQVRRMRAEEMHTLFIDYTHFEKFSEMEGDNLDFDPLDLRNVIAKHYLKLEPNLVNALQTFIVSISAEIAQWALQTNRFSVSFYNVEQRHSLRDLRMGNLGQLVTITGTVTRTSVVQPELLIGTFECSECTREISNVHQNFRFTEPIICPNPRCRNKQGFILKPHQSTFTDWQKIRVQEHANRIPAGSMPRSVDVIVRGDICERVKPGDKIQAVGSMICVPDVPAMMKPGEMATAVKREQTKRFATEMSAGNEGISGLKQLGVRELTHKISFLATYVESDSQWKGGDLRTPEVMMRGGDGGEYPEIQEAMTAEHRDRLREISEHADPFTRLAKAIAPGVCGQEDVKKGILLQLIGGVPKVTRKEGMKLRGDINVCIVGDPSTAKSQFLKWVSDFLPRAVYASGKASTAAGLTAGVARDPESNDVIIEPGALMLSDNGVCCIDEFDKMDAKDQVAIHEAMEQQTISISKAGIQATMNARASILAAANPKWGRYNLAAGLQQNVDISQPLMSRFDLFYVLIDAPDLEDDRQIAQHLLKTHVRGSRGSGENADVTATDLRLYINEARKIQPRITERARVLIVKYYVKLREAEKGMFKRAYRVTVRQLESLVRLSEAVARVFWSKEVKGTHVELAYQLVRGSIRKIDQTDVEIGDDGEADDEELPDQDGDVDMQEAAPRPRARRERISFAEYEQIARSLAWYLDHREQLGQTTTEEELSNWYLEQLESQLHSEEEMDRFTAIVTMVIKRLVDVDKILCVIRESPDKDKPEQRTLTKHPNFVVGEHVSQMMASDVAPAEGDSA